MSLTNQMRAQQRLYEQAMSELSPEARELFEHVMAIMDYAIVKTEQCETYLSQMQQLTVELEELKGVLQ